MSLLTKAAFRVIPGAFFLSSGISKLKMDEEASAGLQQFAGTGMPFVEEVPAHQFGPVVGASEAIIGGALLALPIPNRLAGAMLTPFAIGLCSLYFADPANRQEDGITPTEQGMSLAKDSWLVALGLGLMALGDKD